MFTEAPYDLTKVLTPFEGIVNVVGLSVLVISLVNSLPLCSSLKVKVSPLTKVTFLSIVITAPLNVSTLPTPDPPLVTVMPEDIA